MTPSTHTAPTPPHRAVALLVATGWGVALAAAPGIAAPATPTPGTPGTVTVPDAPTSVDVGSPDGAWYWEAMEVDRAHEVATGQGITVAVIDKPLNPEAPDLVGADVHARTDSFCRQQDGSYHPGVGTGPEARHGTSMVALIAGTGAGNGQQPGIRGIAPGATVRHYATDDSASSPCVHDVGEPSEFGLALDQALRDGADIVSVSMGGALRDGDEAVVARALAHGVVMLFSAPGVGDAGQYDRYRSYASMNGVVVVEAAGPAGMRPTAQDHPLVTVVGPGVDINGTGRDGDWNSYYVSTGSSPATALTAGALAVVWSAHPEATGNQILQTLLRHTFQSNDGHLERVDDTVGYGFVSLPNMLAADPTTYPDTNPLMRPRDPDARPTQDQIAQAAADLDTTTTDPDPAAPDPDTTAVPGPVPADRAPEDGTGTAGLPAPAALAVTALLVLALAGALTALALHRRRRPAPAPEGIL